jgi:hypothetical protein
MTNTAKKVMANDDERKQVLSAVQQGQQTRREDKRKMLMEGFDVALYMLDGPFTQERANQLWRLSSD